MKVGGLGVRDEKPAERDSCFHALDGVEYKDAAAVVLGIRRSLLLNEVLKALLRAVVQHSTIITTVLLLQEGDDRRIILRERQIKNQIFVLVVLFPSKQF